MVSILNLQTFQFFHPVFILLFFFFIAAKENERPQQIDNQKRLDGRTRASPRERKRNYPSLLIRFEVNNLVKSGEQNVTRVARTGPTTIINLSAPSSTRPRWNIISTTEARREFARLLVFVLPPFPRVYVEIATPSTWTMRAVASAFRSDGYTLRVHSKLSTRIHLVAG